MPTPVSTQAVNWAGYIIAADLQTPQRTVTEISAAWVVPTAALSTDDTFSAIWIGIGGQFTGDTSLIQCGTEQDSINGQLVYSAWYELLPRTSITIRNMFVSAGDQMQASIQLADPTINQWSINMTDITTGISFQNNFFYNSNRLSAEWIVERPTVNRVISSLANFGSATFTNCQATVNSLLGTITSFPAQEVVMYSSTSPGANSIQLTDVSNLSVDGSSFTVSYLTQG
jgi:hypothetical protein